MSTPIQDALFEAVKMGDLNSVKNTLSLTPELRTSKSKKGLGLLSFAFAANQEEVFDYLLEELKSEEIFQGNTSYDPVSLAIEYNDEKYLRKLTFSGKVKFNHESTYLIDAIQFDAKPEIIKIINEAGLTLDKPFLVENGLSTFNRILQEPNGQDLLLTLSDEELNKLITKDSFFCLTSNKSIKIEAINKLFKYHKLLTEEEKDTLFTAAYNNKNYILMGEMVDLVGFYPSKSDVYKMINSIITYKQPSQEIIFRDNGKANTSALSAITEAQESQSILKLTEFILQTNPNFNEYPDYYGNPILSDCLNHNKLELFKYFLFKGADVNDTAKHTHTTPLMTAITNHQNSVIELLIESGASTTAINYNGDTPLHIAIYKANYEGIDFLLEKGSAYINGKNNDGYTPLALAINLKDRAIISKLLWKGADIVRSPIEATVQNGFFSLEKGIAEKQLDGVDKVTLNDFLSLANHGLNVNQTNDKGQTLAHFFIETNNVNNFKAFLGLSINPNLKDNQGNTLLMSAAKSIDEIFNLSYMFNPHQTNYISQNNDGKDIYDILIGNKNIKRATQVLEAQLKYRNIEQEVIPTLERVLPTLTYAGDLKNIAPNIEKYVKSNKLDLTDPKGTSLLTVALFTNKLENFELLLKMKPQQIFMVNKNGKSTADIIQLIKKDNAEYYQKIVDIVDKYLPKNLLESTINEPTISISEDIIRKAKETTQPKPPKMG